MDTQLSITTFLSATEGIRMFSYHICYILTISLSLLQFMKVNLKEQLKFPLQLVRKLKPALDLEKQRSTYCLFHTV